MPGPEVDQAQGDDLGDPSAMTSGDALCRANLGGVTWRLLIGRWETRDPRVIANWLRTEEGHGKGGSKSLKLYSDAVLNINITIRIHIWVLLFLD